MKHRKGRSQRRRELLVLADLSNPTAYAAEKVASGLVRETLAKGEPMNSNGNAPALAKPAAPTPEVPHRNRMGRRGQRRLEDWLTHHWGRIEQERPTREDAARQAGALLGFPISAGNISGAVKAIDKRWPTPAATMKAGKTAAERKRYRFAVLVAQVDKLITEFGATALPEWVALCDDMRARIDKGGVGRPDATQPQPPPDAGRFNPPPTKPRGT